MYICNGILFNHRSKRRGETFVTRKITQGVASFFMVKTQYNWQSSCFKRLGHASDYVGMQWMMLQQKKPEDYECSGKQLSVKDFIEKCFKYIGVKLIWSGKGINEIAKVYKTKSKENL